MRPSTRMVTAATAVMAFAGVACSGADSISASDASRQEPLAAVSITPSATSVILGDSVRLSASLNADSSGSAATETAQWTTSDPSVAQVSADGVVSSVDSGSATITARLGTKTGIAKVQVLKTSVASIAITPATSSIQSGQKQQLVATGTDDNGRTIKNLNVKWSSSNPALASVTGNGLVTGIAKGTCVITAQVQGRRATATVTVLDVPVATVAVTLGAAQIAVGQTTQASVTLKDASGSPITGRTVAWQSSNPAMATVNASGLVTALAKSAVTISAIADAKVGSASLTINAAVPASIAITPSALSVTIGQSGQLTAAVRDASGNVIPNRPVTWSSDNEAVATVSATGLVSGVSVGTAGVRATADGLSATATVSVTTVPAAAVTITPTSLTLTAGDTSRLSATVRDASGATIPNRAVVWSSSNPAVASISSTGLLTGVSAGAATITAGADAVTATASVTINAPPPAPVASVAVSFGSATLTLGQTTQATVTLRDVSGNVLTGRSVAWSSASPEVATVSPTGLVTAMAAGTASIIGTSEGQTGAATVTIVAPPPAPVATVALTTPRTSLLIGETAQIVVTLKDAAGNVLTGRTIGWTSSNPSAATVSATGLATGVAPGSATITATSEGKTGSLGLTVAAPAPAPVASVGVSLSATALLVGATSQATATLKDAAGNVLTGRIVTWSSTSPSVSVTSAGLVTALAAGTASVTATSEGVTGSAALTVSAPPPPGAACTLVGDHVQRTEPTGVARPGYLQAMTDPLYKTAITRITGDPGTPIRTAAGQTLGTWGDINTHNYSKDPVWSADQGLIVLKRVKSLGAALFLDGATYQPLFVKSPPGGASETRWHPTIPDEMVIVTSTASVKRWNVRTNVVTTLFTASGYSAADWSWEGDMSTDARYVAIRATRAADGKRVGFRADLVTGAKGPDIDFAANGITDPDVVSVSANGTYVVVTGQIPGAGTCCGGVTDATKVFAAATGAFTGQYFSEYGRPSHYDHAVDASGNEVIVGVSKSAPNEGRVIMRRLVDGVVTVLDQGGYAAHTSARNTARPGWAYVTHSYNGPNWPPYRDEILAVKLDGSQTIERYGNMHSMNSGGDYDAEPHAVPAPDGRRVIFASAWEAAGVRPVHTYVADARPLCR